MTDRRKRTHTHWTEEETTELLKVPRYRRVLWKTNKILQHKTEEAIMSRRYQLRRKGAL
jgi:hypothetical protein